jgi:hypothetical protein
VAIVDLYRATVLVAVTTVTVRERLTTGDGEKQSEESDMESLHW